MKVDLMAAINIVLMTALKVAVKADVKAAEMDSQKADKMRNSKLAARSHKEIALHRSSRTHLQAVHRNLVNLDISNQLPYLPTMMQWSSHCKWSWALWSSHVACH